VSSRHVSSQKRVQVLSPTTKYPCWKNSLLPPSDLSKKSSQ
jgi:hypothetical protein